MFTLFLVATPIGNLEDITFRALRVLRQVSLIAAEDTRTAHRLLTHFQITTPVTSYYEPIYARGKRAQTEGRADPAYGPAATGRTKLGAIMDALEHGDVAVISEAGMPGLSDPGYELVRAAIERGIRVSPIPGANALTAALVASGLPTDQFVYLGFLPRQPSARRKFLAAQANEPRTLIAYEAPHRVAAALQDIESQWGNRKICVAREITKLYEEFFRGTVADARARFVAQEPRGEFVLVVQGRTAEDKARTADEWSDARVKKQVKRLMQAGMSRTDAVKQVANESGGNRRHIYQLAASD